MRAQHETIEADRDGATVTIALNRPETLNAINVLMLEELVEVFEELRRDPEVGVIVLTGRGRAFSAGVDLRELSLRPLETGSLGDVIDTPARRLIELIRFAPAIVVAKVNGDCFSGALELVLACDLVIADEAAQFADTYAKLGLRPSWGLSQRLPRVVGSARARELSYTARKLSGAEAVSWGLAIEAVPADQLDAALDDLIGRLAQMSSGALRTYKDLYRHGEEAALAEGLLYEASSTGPIDDTADRIRHLFGEDAAAVE